MSETKKSTTVVRYRVKPEHVDENERLSKAVYAELAEVRPANLKYATWKLEDGVTFVHVASADIAEGEEFPLSSMPAFRAFRAGLDDRCDEGPIVSPSETVGVYDPAMYAVA